jgi:hypothetical protein
MPASSDLASCRTCFTVVGERRRARVAFGNRVNGRIGRRRYDIVGNVLITNGVNRGYSSVSSRTSKEGYIPT